MAKDPERHARVVASLKRSRYDAVICDSATEVLLLTGYWPVMGASVAIFTKGGEVAVILPEDEVELAAKTSCAEFIPYKPAGLHTLSTPPEMLKEPLRIIANKLKLAHATIGLQLGHGMQPASYAASNRFRASLHALTQELQPEADCIACDDLLAQMEAIKTAKELELMEHACRVAAAGFSEAAAAILPGSRESEIAATLQSAFANAREAEGLERSYGYFFCMSGLNSATAAAAYARTRQRIVEQGDLVMIHANTCADGYWTDITRTYTAGEPNARQHDMAAAVHEARGAGLRAIRPGVTGGDVDTAARSVMTSRGFGNEFKHATGHGVGFAAANPNARPRIHPLSPDVLEPGMTFNVEPAAYFDGYGGIRHCDVVAVTESGVKVLSGF